MKNLTPNKIPQRKVNKQQYEKKIQIIPQIRGCVCVEQHCQTQKKKTLWKEMYLFNQYRVSSRLGVWVIENNQKQFGIPHKIIWLKILRFNFEATLLIWHKMMKLWTITKLA